MERFPNINKISGDIPNTKVEEKLEGNREKSIKRYEDFEIPVSEEEQQIIDEVSFGIRVMLEHVYKVDCKEILKDRIHIVKEGTLKGKHGFGIYQSPTGDIYLESLISCKSKIIFTKILAHELIHYLSFNSVKAFEEDEKVRVLSHVEGLNIARFEESTIKNYFNVVDEALTSYISNEFLNLELHVARSGKGDARIYTNECLAIDMIREWLRGLPDFIGIDKDEWDKSYALSIPFAEEIAGVLKSDLPTEEKIVFYKKKMSQISREEKREYYLERMRELDDVYREVSAMFALEEKDPIIVREKTVDFFEKMVLLKLTGKGFLDIVRFVEKRLGLGSFKKLAEKFSKTEERK